VRILVLSDTHIPRVIQDLPESVYGEIKNVDMILHAGDFIDIEVLRSLEKLKKVHAVYGNMDCPELRRTLKNKDIIQAGGFRIGLIHGYGAPKELMETVKAEFTNVDAIVFGHSHTATNIVKDGVLFFNPGSPTDTVFTAANTYGILEITDKKIEGTIVTI
jgi:putative phosphoesterase